ITKLPGLPATDTFQQFPIDAYFTHLNGTGAPAGINTLYLSDNGPGFANGHITKWALINNSITSATESGNTVTITTASATGLTPGETVTIAGVGFSGYNGTFTVLTVSGSTFTYLDSNTGLPNTSGGNAVYWNLVDTVTAGTGNSAVSFFWLSG